MNVKIGPSIYGIKIAESVQEYGADRDIWGEEWRRESRLNYNAQYREFVDVLRDYQFHMGNLPQWVELAVFWAHRTKPSSKIQLKRQVGRHTRKAVQC